VALLLAQPETSMCSFKQGQELRAVFEEKAVSIDREGKLYRISRPVYRAVTRSCTVRGLNESDMLVAGLFDSLLKIEKVQRSRPLVTVQRGL
jgi:hypothetical protein